MTITILTEPWTLIHWIYAESSRQKCAFFFYFQIWISFLFLSISCVQKNGCRTLFNGFPHPIAMNEKTQTTRFQADKLWWQVLWNSLNWLTDWLTELNWPNGYMLRYKRSEQKNSFFSYFETSVPSIVLLNVFLMFFHSDIIITNGCEQLSFVFCTFMNGIHVCDMMTFVSKSSFKMNLFFTLYQNSLAKGQRS